MRWAGQAISTEAGDPAALPGLDQLHRLVRSVRTPEFAGITFHEVLAKSALNRVPKAAALPFNWTVNPYRGCSHGCVYCFARHTHTYLDLDAGDDFDRQIIVKINIGDVLARELRRPTWTHEPVALGTNTDPYQPIERKYQVMRQILEVLERAGHPVGIVTKSALILRDLDILARMAERNLAKVAISVTTLDPKLARVMEPRAATPGRRLEALALLGIGFRRLSITPVAVGPIKDLVRKIDLAEITAAMNAWLSSPPASMRDELSAWADARGIDVD